MDRSKQFNFVNRIAAKAVSRMVHSEDARSQIKALSTVLGLPMATVRQRLYFGFFNDLENTWFDSLTKEAAR